MDQNDLKQIREEIGSVIVDNLMPVLDELKSDVSEIKSDVSELKSDVSELKSDVSELKSDVSELKSDMVSVKSEIGGMKSQMVTKEYLDDKLADLEGITIVRQKKEGQKFNLLIEILKERGTLTDNQINQLKEIKVFPA